MCGIIGIVGEPETNVSSLLLDGLKRLEYRGYDSAGITTLSGEGELLCCRRAGKIGRLEQAVNDNPMKGRAGIGHTRWATHGRPTEANAHPHQTDRVAVVHNGIVENFLELRAGLEAEGCAFKSDTDTEVIPHLITRYLRDGMMPEDAVAATLEQLTGSFALAILFAGKNPLLMAARRGSPLAVGFNAGRLFVGSDAIVLAPFTSNISFLEDGDVARLDGQQVAVSDEHGNRVERRIWEAGSPSAASKGGYRHYMLKEIREQPAVLAGVLAHYVDPVTRMVSLPELAFNPADVSRMSIVACGTSYYAGMVGKYWIEALAHIPVTLDIASEFRYREAPVEENCASLFISQSGETADTLAAMRKVKAWAQPVIGLVNVPQSAMAQLADTVLPILAGPEIGVASTKAFTAQLMGLACLALAFAAAKGSVTQEVRDQVMASLVGVPQLVMDVLAQEDKLRELANEIKNRPDVFFIGRGLSYPVALEGALKLKELAYIHAEGLAAGELKHGPLALVSDGMPVIVLAPSDSLFDKTCSNIQEVSARGGMVIALCDSAGAAKLEKIAARIIVMPACHPLTHPVVYVVALQLLAYYTALAKGNDVDQPRNLAKSVTVE